MELKIAKQIVNKILGPMRNAMGLNDWRVNVIWVRVTPKIQITLEPEYRTATIDIDNEGYEEAEELLTDIRHELCHILHAMFNHYRECVANKKLDANFNLASEYTVGQIERLLDNLGFTPEKLVKKGL